MASAARDKDEVAPSLSRLRLDDASEAKATSKKPPAAGAAKTRRRVVDSWEDDDDDDDEPDTPHSAAAHLPSAPPPTPMSPHFSHAPSWDALAAGAPAAGSSRPSPSTPPARRPEKTDAVARRMITAGLGLKAPRQTEEQKAYQRSVREQERKRMDHEREQERRKQLEAEQAKAAVWDD